MRAGQRDGVLLLFLAVFLFCLAVVPGQSLWGAIQGFLLGVFGWCVFLWIGLLVYFAVLLFLRRVQKPQVVRGVQLALFILLLSSALHILGHDTVGMGWAEDLKDAYAQGFGGIGGGAVGAMLGGILLFFGRAPAAVTVILLMLVDLTLLCWPMIAERLQEREEIRGRRVKSIPARRRKSRRLCRNQCGRLLCRRNKSAAGNAASAVLIRISRWMCLVLPPRCPNCRPNSSSAQWK